jgi:flagellar biosynthesis/type III secretory pathway protein FliH
MPAANIEEWSASQVKVVADTTVKRGGCLVESPFGFVDASVDAQFQELARALMDAHAAGLESREP